MKIIVITGASDGIGAEIARQLAAAGKAQVGLVLAARNVDALNAAGVAADSSRLKEDHAMSVETCAGLIIDGMQRRQREVVMTGKGKLGRFLKLVAPGTVEKMALAALKDDVKPRA